MSPPLVITRELYKHDDQGNQNTTQIIIEFTIVAISKALKEAVAQGKGAVERSR